MSDTNILPQKTTVFKRTGDVGVFTEAKALEATFPDLTVGEMERALESLTRQDIQNALNEKAAR
jgi:predicted nucleic acid-binding protein